MLRIRNQLKITNDLLDKYKEYYEPGKKMKNRLDISENTAISNANEELNCPLWQLVAVGVWAYFGVLERITMLETKSQLSEKDLNQHVERIGAELDKE